MAVHLITNLVKQMLFIKSCWREKCHCPACSCANLLSNPPIHLTSRLNLTAGIRHIRFWPTSTVGDESVRTAECCPIFISGTFYKVISADEKRSWRRRRQKSQRERKYKRKKERKEPPLFLCQIPVCLSKQSNCQPSRCEEFPCSALPLPWLTTGWFRYFRKSDFTAQIHSGAIDTRVFIYLFIAGILSWGPI